MYLLQMELQDSLIAFRDETDYLNKHLSLIKIDFL